MKDSDDFFGLYQFILEAHTFKNDIVMDTDKLDVKIEFGMFKKQGYKAGDTLAEYKEKYDLELEKLRNYGQEDQYNDKEKMLIFLCPLQLYKNDNVQGQINTWFSNVDSDPLPKVVSEAFQRLKARINATHGVYAVFSSFF